MKQFVEWIAAYRYRTAVAAMALAGTPFLMPLSIGMVALSALRGKPQDGLLVTGGAMLALALLEPLMSGALVLAVITGLAYWLPGVGLAILLQRSGSLALCLQVLTLIGLAAVGVFWLGAESPETWWLPWLEEYFVPFLQQSQPQVDSGVLLPAVARYLTGGIVALWLLTMAGGLMLGRWWQGMLGDSELLGPAFRTHRQGRAVGGIAAVVFVAAGLTDYLVLENLVVVLVAMFMLQGLALAHWLVREKGLKAALLVAIYLALPFGTPWSLVILAAVGFMDNWMLLRRVRPATD